MGFWQSPAPPKELPVSGRVLARLAPVVLVLAAALSACGGDGDTDPPATSQSPSADGDTDPSATSQSPSTDDDTVAVTVTREGDSFTPNGERVELGVDQTLVLTIDADEAGELHVHSTPEQDISYEAGASEHEITIDRPGVVEVESHDPDLIVLQLEVR
ncbi:hypothetical protein IEZ24_02140 [Nocardioides ganghwensis]|jgi:hypothetical protein|uniref:EfeO-type cupredoxin-like domain-containing protein n=1 Tax=Nocardioides ganghwensis TaxID=252230 RepID=A0A4Q2S9V0_9ACTN|nr:hypothetical protein [Nocardioides ganghwensis]RYB97464.1 hypothetical protein EUA07_19855 [Nocardioides ganghwensis]